MKVTVRLLTRHKFIEPHGRPRHTAGHDHHEDEFAARPVDVSVRDRVVELEEVRGLLDRGEASPTDLINDGSGWLTISEHPAIDVSPTELAYANSLLKFAYESGDGVSVALWALVALGFLATVAFAIYRSYRPG